MAENLPSETRTPQKTTRVCTVCKEYVKHKKYRSLASEPSEPYRKYMTEIGIPATGYVCYPCVRKFNRLVKIDRDLSTLLDRLKQKRIHLMCELKMLSTGMDQVDANFTSRILGMTPQLEVLSAPPPKKKKVDEEISTAHFSHILPKKQPVLVIQNPVPKLPETVSLGESPVIIQAVQGTDMGSVPLAGNTKTHPVVGLVSHQVKSKPRPVVPRPIQPSKQGVDIVSQTGKNNASKPLQPVTHVKKELPKILPRPLQVRCDLESTWLGSGKNGTALPVVSNVVVQTQVPVFHDVSTVASGVIVQPGTPGPVVQCLETSEIGASVAGPLSINDKGCQTPFPLDDELDDELEDLNSEYQNSSQCQTREEVCLKNGFERIVTESGDEYDIVKQEFSDSESCDSYVPGSEIEGSSGGIDGDESSSQSFSVKQEPQEEFQTSVEQVSKNCLTSHQEQMKDSSDSGMSVSQSVDIKQERHCAFDSCKEHVSGGGVYCDSHVKQTSDTGDSGESVSQSVDVKQEHVPEGGAYCDSHVKQPSDTGDSGASVPQRVEERHSAFNSRKEHVSGGGVYCDSHMKQTSDTGDSGTGRSACQNIVIKQEQCSFEHISSSDWDNYEEQLEHRDEGYSCLSLSQNDVIKKELPGHADALRTVICTDSNADNLPEHFVKHEVT